MISIKKLIGIFETAPMGVRMDAEVMPDWTGPEHYDINLTEENHQEHLDDIVLEVYRNIQDERTDSDASFTLRQLLDGNVQNGDSLYCADGDGLIRSLSFYTRINITLDD